MPSSFPATLRARPGAEPVALEECSLDYIAWGVAFTLAADSPYLFERMSHAAPVGAARCSHPQSSRATFALRQSGGDGQIQLFRDSELVAEEISLADALLQLGAHLTIYVAEYSPDFVFVHAGVVAWGGRALLLPGVSFAGKSTLVAELVRAGATYFSDEFAPIDSQGLIHPFLRDLRMRVPGGREQRTVPIDQLNGPAGALPVAVSLVVFTQYEINGTWDPQPMSPGQATLEALLHTVPVQRTPSRVLATLKRVMGHAQSWRSSRAEASIVSTSLLTALETGVLR